MRRKKIVARDAVRDFLAGRCCAEVVIDQVGREVIEDFDPELARIGTGFVGGVGNCGDTCGTLIGAIVIIGLLTGCRRQGDDRRRCARLSAEYRRRFSETLGAVDCRVLTARHLPGAGHIGCTKIVAKGVTLLLDLLEEEGFYGA